MEKTDGRKLSPQVMEEIRKRTVARVHAGESPEKVFKTRGFASACIYNWLVKYRSGGWHALKTGKRPGRPKILTGSQIRFIARISRTRRQLSCGRKWIFQK
jgi:transposase